MARKSGVQRAEAVFVPPQLATLADSVPEGDTWLHEVKYDGYRVVAVANGRSVRLLTRNGLDWTHRFHGIADGIAAIGRKQLVLDGEVVAYDSGGRTSFQALQQALDGSERQKLHYVAFDLLHLDGLDLTSLPLTERRAALVALLKPIRGRNRPQLSEELPGRGEALLAAACRLELEGIICKRRDAPYRSGRSTAWLKVKCGKRQEFVVVGYTPPRGSRFGLGSLLLGVTQRGGIRYAGRVGTGMPDALLRSLVARLAPLKRTASPLADPPRGLPAGTQWVEPRLVVEVAFTEWTADARLRHPVLIAVREDKKPREVKRERAIATDAVEESMATTKGVTITNPQRIVYPETGLTKADVAAYIAKVAPLMLPHVAGRPLTFVRCPEGIADQCFFQKHWTGEVPKALSTIPIRQGDGQTKPYVVVHDATGLVTLVQWGILEIHLWGSRADDVDKPDRVTFDLDPGEGVTWPTMRTAALAVRTLLDAVGLDCWLKTSGGKGLHVVVPIARHSTWDDVSEFARAVAERLSAEAPKRFVSVAAKAQRPGKVFIDWLRNTRGATSVAPWSMRARPGAGVSVPIAWSRLATTRSGDHHVIPSIMKARLPADAWKAMPVARQRLTRKIVEELKG